MSRFSGLVRVTAKVQPLIKINTADDISSPCTGNESRFPSRGTLIRSESFENASSLSKPRFQRNLGRFFPRRRFSQSAIETIRELFEEVGIQSSSQDQHQKQLVQDCKDVRRLSKDEIMSELEKRRSSMDLPDYPDWTTLRCVQHLIDF